MGSAEPEPRRAGPVRKDGMVLVEYLGGGALYRTSEVFETRTACLEAMIDRAEDAVEYSQQQLERRQRALAELRALLAAGAEDTGSEVQA